MGVRRGRAARSRIPSLESVSRLDDPEPTLIELGDTSDHRLVVVDVSRLGRGRSIDQGHRRAVVPAVDDRDPQSIESRVPSLGTPVHLADLFYDSLGHPWLTMNRHVGLLSPEIESVLHR